MIVLGLVGTFFGLTLSISELVTLLNNTNDVISGDVTTITGGLLSSINGMSVAFVTSLFGITASIIVNILTIIVGISDSKEQYLSVIEEYLDNTLGEKTANLTDLNENGKTPLEVAFEVLASQLKESMDEISNSMSYRLTVASGNMKDASDSLEKSMLNFNESINQFSENTRDFSEFNHHLKTNIQRMSIAFDDLTETLKETNKS
jgi:methyl-accepting chemotaxis protein